MAKNIFEFPENILFIDTLDVNGCILDDRKRDIDYIAKNIWEGSRNIFSFLFGGDECYGIKDILDDWLKEGIVSVIFYIPRESAKEIRDNLIKKMRTHTLSEKIEHFIESQIRENIPNFDIYNLNTTDNLSDIFDISKLKRELDRDSKSDVPKIYLIGLKFSLSSSTIGCYINNIPIYEQGGAIYGDSNILTHKLKKGFLVVKYDEGIDIEFYGTDKFSSNDYDVGSDLAELDFTDESISFELEGVNKPIIIESRVGEKLIFSKDQNIAYAPKKIIDPKDIVTRDTKIYMNAFFIPKEKGLKFIKLLLIYKNGKKVLAGGEYHHGLLDCDIIGDLSIDLEQEEITFVNHSNSNLKFINFDNAFWKLDESSIFKEPTDYIEEVKSEDGIYTTVLIDDVDLNTSFEDEIEADSSTTQIIKQEESFTFKVREIEFNDSNISFDKTGIFISYSMFEIAKFQKEFSLNRTAFKMSKLGTIVDCFVERPKGRNFKWGSKVYIHHSDILGRAISSKPIIFKNSSEGLLIENRLNTKYYMLQISSFSQKYILDGTSSNSIVIPNNELKDLKVDIINKGYKNRPLVQFSLKA